MGICECAEGSEALIRFSVLLKNQTFPSFPSTDSETGDAATSGLEWSVNMSAHDNSAKAVGEKKIQHGLCLWNCKRFCKKKCHPSFFASSLRTHVLKTFFYCFKNNLFTLLKRVLVAKSGTTRFLKAGWVMRERLKQNSKEHDAAETEKTLSLSRGRAAKVLASEFPTV